MKSRGYLTIGVGLEYLKLAEMLIKSFRIHNTTKNFSLITDVETQKYIEDKELFDEVLICTQQYESGYLYKLDLLNLTPYESTIFIDSDCLIVGSLDFLWDKFNGTKFGVTGSLGNRNNHPNHFFDFAKVNSEYNIEEFPIFNGGFYYFESIPEVTKLFNTFREIAHCYDELGLKRLSGSKNDEAIVSVGMAIFKLVPVNDYQKEVMFCTPGLQNISIDVLKGQCDFLKYDEWVSPAIMHFGALSTNFFHYKREIKSLNVLEKTNSNILVRLARMFDTFLYVCKVFLYRMIKKRKLTFRNLTPFNMYQ